MVLGMKAGRIWKDLEGSGRIWKDLEGSGRADDGGWLSQK
jgi:hypothetical protein